jgi:hypothetical protein
VYNSFTKINGLHIQKAASDYLEDLLQNESDLVVYLEKLIKAYKKRYEGKTK